MERRKGKLIVIEGTDGSGKATQVNILVKRLASQNYKVTTAAFPQYGGKSAGLVEEYLNGKYGTPNQVSPYIASLFYALDRFDLSNEIRTRLAEGRIMVLDRYVDSNAGHQGGKIKNKKSRQKFLNWLYQLEFDILKIPQPDIVLILHMPTHMGQKLALQKQQSLYLEEGDKKQDIHEADLAHLQDAEAAYLWLAQKYPSNHLVIECTKDGKILSEKIIHKRVWDVIKSILPKQRARAKSA